MIGCRFMVYTDDIRDTTVFEVYVPRIEDARLQLRKRRDSSPFWSQQIPASTNLTPLRIDKSLSVHNGIHPKSNFMDLFHNNLVVKLNGKIKPLIFSILPKSIMVLPSFIFTRGHHGQSLIKCSTPAHQYFSVSVSAPPPSPHLHFFFRKKPIKKI